MNKNCPKARSAVRFISARLDPSSAAAAAASLFLPRDGELCRWEVHHARPTPIMLFLSCIKENSRARGSRNLFAPARGKHNARRQSRGRSTAAIFLNHRRLTLESSWPRDFVPRLERISFSPRARSRQHEVFGKWSGFGLVREENSLEEGF